MKWNACALIKPCQLGIKIVQQRVYKSITVACNCDILFICNTFNSASLEQVRKRSLDLSIDCSSTHRSSFSSRCRQDPTGVEKIKQDLENSEVGRSAQRPRASGKVRSCQSRPSGTQVTSLVIIPSPSQTLNYVLWYPWGLDNEYSGQVLKVGLANSIAGHEDL